MKYSIFRSCISIKEGVKLSLQTPVMEESYGGSDGTGAWEKRKG